MKKFKLLIIPSLLLVFSLLLSSCNTKNNINTTNTTTESKSEGSITVAAAASLTDALREIKVLFEEKNNGNIQFTYGASGALQKQIEEGAPIDIFVSASNKNMEYLVDKDIIDKDSVKILLKNSLILITTMDSNVKTVKDLANINDEIAIGETETVPAGQYAKEVLENLNLWETLQPKLVFGKDVRAVLSYVSSEEAEVGFVYKTDAKGEQNIIIAEEIDSELHKAIDYPIGIIKDTKNRKLADAFA